MRKGCDRLNLDGRFILMKENLDERFVCYGILVRGYPCKIACSSFYFVFFHLLQEIDLLFTEEGPQMLPSPS